MTFDKVFSIDLQNYIINHSSAESPLLTNLRHETTSFSPLAHMLCGPIEGKLLYFLVKLSNSKTCLELGTFTGYSALNIASALPGDGKLITCENREDHALLAQKYFDRSPDGHKITLVLGDAIQTITQLNNYFDFIFIDADKANYPNYYDILIPKLRSGGLMVIDNALWGGEVVSPQDKEAKSIDLLNQKACKDPNVETVMLSVRDGILLIRKL